MKKEKTISECSHRWALVMAKHEDQIVSVPTAKICLDCGILKVGTRTIRIANDRLDMGNKPIRNASEADIATRLKIPVGTNMYI
jgi:hypothetical protein